MRGIRYRQAHRRLGRVALASPVAHFVFHAPPEALSVEIRILIADVTILSRLPCRGALARRRQPPQGGSACDANISECRDLCSALFTTSFAHI